MVRVVVDIVQDRGGRVVMHGVDGVLEVVGRQPDGRRDQLAFADGPGVEANRFYVRNVARIVVLHDERHSERVSGVQHMLLVANQVRVVIARDDFAETVLKTNQLTSHPFRYGSYVPLKFRLCCRETRGSRFRAGGIRNRS